MQPYTCTIGDDCYDVVGEMATDVGMVTLVRKQLPVYLISASDVAKQTETIDVAKPKIKRNPEPSSWRQLDTRYRHRRRS